MEKLIAPFLLIGVAACATSAAEGKTREQLISELNVLAVKCSPTKQVQFELIGKTQLRVLPSPTASFDEVGCFLSDVKPYQFDLGFIGNEAPMRQ